MAERGMLACNGGSDGDACVVAEVSKSLALHSRARDGAWSALMRTPRRNFLELPPVASLSLVTPSTLFNSTLYIAIWSAFQSPDQDDASTPADAVESVRPAAAAAMG